MPDTLISFYGDDFTGSTDAMESLARSGIRTVLFTRPPTEPLLEKHPGIQAFGIAGMTRSMPPAEMEKELRPALVALRDSGAPIVHYKVCSTFDSSPAVGSIGRVIEIGREVFGNRKVPVLVGAPSLGRYCVFGNLFARLGGEGETFRLDRHPSMSRHPVTPMNEADLRIHLAKQTSLGIGLLNIVQLDQPNAGSIFDGIREPIVLIDLLQERQLPIAGKLLDDCDKPLFVVGSSGVESALAARWAQNNRLKRPGGFNSPGSARPIVAVCGSCSPVTAGQIQWAIAHGFAEVAVDVRSIDSAAPLAQAMSFLNSGRSVVIHTGMGKTEHRIESPAAGAIGPLLASILDGILRQIRIKRVIIAGGDTSGAIARGLGIESMEMIAELTRGSPLVRVSAPNSHADGVEFTFKGGQIGKQNFFTFVRDGHE